MSAIFNKKELTDEDYIIKFALIYLGMRKIKDENLTKIMNDDANKSALGDFAGRSNFLFVNATGAENLAFAVDPPAQSAIKRKALLVIKARPETKE
jgi:hypothetical protein